MSHFIPYGRQWLDDTDKQAIIQVLNSDYLTQGPKVAEFEHAICAYTGAKYCVAVANGTAALHLAVLALNINKDSEGITSPITFVASANCLAYAGLKPVFADIRSNTYNLDFGEVKKRATAKTKLIVAVDFAGQPADMEKIYPWAKKRGIAIIEDAAHAIGSSYTNGSKVGSCRWADLTTFSFHPVKTVTTGEGGAVTTNNPVLYQKLLLLRSHGITKNPAELSRQPGPWYYEMQTLGFNYRLTDIQAALGLSQFRKLNKFVNRRREIVRQYNMAFRDLPNVTTPYEKDKVYSAFHLYILSINFKKIGISRQGIMEKLKTRNIGTQVHYIPVHLQPYYQQHYGYGIGDYPRAEHYYEQCLSLPLYPKMSNANIAYVIKTVKNILSEGESNEP